MGPGLRLIINPHSGGGKAGRLAEQAQALLSSDGFSVRREQLSERDAVAAAAKSAAEAAEIVTVIGGDGIIGAAGEGLACSDADRRLAIIPAGRGNDLARALSIPQRLRAACDVIAAGHLQRMDLAAVNGRVFAGIASVGFDCEANRIANAAPRWLGAGSYAYGAIGALWRWQDASFQLQIRSNGGAAAPEEHLTITGYSVSIANSPYFGGGMRLAPMADLADGRLDMIGIGQMGRLGFALRAPSVFLGRHLRFPAVTWRACTSVWIEGDGPRAVYADGDPIGTLPAEIKVLPGAIRVFTPAPTAGAARPAPLRQLAVPDRSARAGGCLDRSAGRIAPCLGRATSRRRGKASP